MLSYTPRRSVSACQRAGGAHLTAAFPLSVRAGRPRRAIIFQLAVRAGVAHRAAALHPSVRARGAVRAVVFHPAVGTRVTLLALLFLPSVRARGAVRAVVFHPAVRTRVTLLALLFLPSVRARGAVRAVVFHPAVRTRVTLLALLFLPSVRAPLISHHARSVVVCRAPRRVRVHAKTGVVALRSSFSSFVPRKLSKGRSFFVTSSPLPHSLVRVQSLLPRWASACVTSQVRPGIVGRE